MKYVQVDDFSGIGMYSTMVVHVPLGPTFLTAWITEMMRLFRVVDRIKKMGHLAIGRVRKVRVWGEALHDVLAHFPGW